MNSITPGTMLPWVAAPSAPGGADAGIQAEFLGALANAIQAALAPNTTTVVVTGKEAASDGTAPSAAPADAEETAGAPTPGETAASRCQATMPPVGEGSSTEGPLVDPRTMTILEIVATRMSGRPGATAPLVAAPDPGSTSLPTAGASATDAAMSTPGPTAAPMGPGTAEEARSALTTQAPAPAVEGSEPAPVPVELEPAGATVALVPPKAEAATPSGSEKAAPSARRRHSVAPSRPIAGAQRGEMPALDVIARVASLMQMERGQSVTDQSAIDSPAPTPDSSTPSKGGDVPSQSRSRIIAGEGSLSAPVSAPTETEAQEPTVATPEGVSPTVGSPEATLSRPAQPVQVAGKSAGIPRDQRLPDGARVESVSVGTTPLPVSGEGRKPAVKGALPADQAKGPSPTAAGSLAPAPEGRAARAATASAAKDDKSLTLRVTNDAGSGLEPAGAETAAKPAAAESLAKPATNESAPASLSMPSMAAPASEAANDRPLVVATPTNTAGKDPLSDDGKLSAPMTQATIQLTDENGDSTRIRVAVRGDQVRATIVQPEGPVAARLGERLDELKNALGRQGFSDARIAVHTPSPSDALPTWGAAGTSARVEAAPTRGQDAPAGDQRQGSGRRDSEQAGHEPGGQRHGRSHHRAPRERER